MSVKVICYLCGGYPSVDESMAMAEHYVKGGCDAIECSLPPKDPNRDGEFIRNLMHIAYEKCHDYEVYLQAIKKFKQKHPETEVFLLLYNEVIMKIGADRLRDFCKETGIQYVISGDLKDEKMIEIFREYGIKLARVANYKMQEEDIQRCIETDGFTYMQAFPNPGQYIKPGFEELDVCMKYLRERKVSEPIYCGGGIKGPADAARVKAAGGNGFFVGSSIIKLYDDPEALEKLIREYKDAVKD